jgi:hypothetical protein
MELERQLALNNTTIDHVTSSAKAITGMVPIVGSILTEVIGNIIPNQRLDRIAKFLQLLSERLSILEQKIVEDKFKQTESIDLLEDAFIQASRATTDERLKHIAEVVANGLSPDEIKHAEAKRMLWLLGQLNDAELIILRSRLVSTVEDAEADSEFRKKHGDLITPPALHRGSSEADFEESALKISYRQNLSDLGLIENVYATPRKNEMPEFDNRTGMMKVRSTSVTRLGKMLLRYLNLIPDWYRM